MPTLAEKIEAVVREAFHDGWLELDDVSERLLLTLCRRAANLALKEATERFGAFECDIRGEFGFARVAHATEAILLDLTLPEDKT